MPDFDSLDYRYSDAPDKVKRSPVPGPNVSTVRLTRPVTEDTRAKALRVFIVAYPQCVGRPAGRHNAGQSQISEPIDRCAPVAHAAGVGRPQGCSIEAPSTYARQPHRSGWWTTKPDVGRVAYGVPRRVDRLRALGNAVVPQVAEHIGHLVNAMMEA